MNKIICINVLLLVLCCTEFVASKPGKHKKYENDKDENEYPEEMSNDGEDYDAYSEEEDAYPGPEPQMNSVSEKIRVREGETVYLPCDVTRADAYVTMWYKGDKMLFQDGLAGVQNPQKYKRYENRTLRISEVSVEDINSYKCEILSQPAIEVVHYLNVTTQPKIVKITPENSIQAEVNSMVKLTCEVSGNPAPKVVWSKEGKRLYHRKTEKFYGNTVTLEKISPSDAGTYQCVADNGIGNPAHGHVVVHVRHAPIIKVDKPIVANAEGYSAELSCIVHAHPLPIVEWFRNGTRLSTTPRINITSRGNHHYLEISKTKTTDFGSYSCTAGNPIGTTTKDIELTGAPGPAQFTEIGTASDGKSPVLTWTIESYYPIVEYSLQYKRLEESEWTTDTNIKVENSVGNKYKVKHELLGLPQGRYEARLSAKNTFGWSHYSHKREFDSQPVPENISASANEVAICTAILSLTALLLRLN